MALALGEQRDQHVGAGDFLAAGILHMQHGALHDALEAGGRLGVLAILDHQRHQLFVDVFLHGLAQRIGIDVAGLHDLRRVGVVHQREQQMLGRRVFVMPVARELDRAVQRLFEASRE